jgi:hypothetical protein
MLKIEHMVSKIGHIVFAENVFGELFVMFGFQCNLVWYEKVSAHIFTFLFIGMFTYDWF